MRFLSADRPGASAGWNARAWQGCRRASRNLLPRSSGHDKRTAPRLILPKTSAWLTQVDHDPVGATTELAEIEPSITPESNASPLNSWMARGSGPGPWTRSLDRLGSRDGSIQDELGGGACGSGRGWITIHLCRY